MVIMPVCLTGHRGSIPLRTANYGECSSMVESWIVIPIVVGSNPIIHPNIIYNTSLVQGIEYKATNLGMGVRISQEVPNLVL